MTPEGALVLGVFALVLLVAVAAVVHHVRLSRHLRRHGVDVTATVTKVAVRRDLDDDVMLSRRWVHSYEAIWTDPETGRTERIRGTYRTGSRDGALVAVGSPLTVSLDPRNPRRHLVRGLPG